jgi:hypothetical protein
MMVASMIIGCRDLGSNPSSGDLVGEQSVMGKFVVDSYAIECTVKVNPATNSLQACFPWTVKYHFEGRPGSVFTMVFVPVGYLSTNVFISPVFPDSTGRIFGTSSQFWTNSSLAQLDSIPVRFSLSGEYWDRVDRQEQTYGSFEWGVNKTLPIRRQ